MTKELFIESIDAIEKQYDYDIEVSKKFAEIFKDAFEANLLYQNHYVNDALLKVLQVENNDTVLCKYGQSWIEYFCFELNFGTDYKTGCATFKNGENIDLSDSGKLWEFLNRKPQCN